MRLASRGVIAALSLLSDVPVLAQGVARVPGFRVDEEAAAAASRSMEASAASTVRLAEPVGSVVVGTEATLVGRELFAVRSRLIGANGAAALLGVAPKLGLGLPLSARISSGFGLRVHPIDGYLRQHSGVDLAAPYGTPIVSTMNGAVQSTGVRGGYGILVEVRGGAGLSTRYAHMSRSIVSAGEFVRQGQVLGYVGSTGHSTGAHLHYEVRLDGRAVDPVSMRQPAWRAKRAATAAQTPSLIRQAVF